MAEEGPGKPPGNLLEELARKLEDGGGIHSEGQQQRNQRRLLSHITNGNNQGVGSLPTNRPPIQLMSNAGAQLPLNPFNLAPNASVPIQGRGPPPLIAGQSPSGYTTPAYFSNPQQQLQMESMQQQVPIFTHFNPGAILGNVNLNALSNPLAWSGMKNIRDSDVESIIHEHWNTQLVLVGWSPYRKPIVNLENDLFIRSYTEEPWRKNGNVVFFCEGRTVVRCHSILLQSILPEFFEELLHMSTFQYHASIRTVELPFIPICVNGIDQRIIEHLVSLIFRGLAVLTGKEIQQLLMVIDILRINELIVCIAPTPGNSCNPEWLNSTVAAGVSTAEQSASLNSVPIPNAVAPCENCQHDEKSNRSENPDSSCTCRQDVNAHCGEIKVEQLRFQNPGASVTNPTCVRAAEASGLHIGSTHARKPSSANSGTTSSASGDDDGDTKSMETPEYKQLDDHSSPMNQDQTQDADVKLEPGASSMSCESNKELSPSKDLVSVSTQPSTVDNLGCEEIANRPGLHCDDLGAKSGPVGPDSPVRRRRSRIKSERIVGKKMSLQRRVSESKGSPSDGDDEDDADRKKRKRTVYPKGLRVQALEALNDGKTVRDVAQTLDVPPKLISRWKYEAKKAESDDLNVPCGSLNEGPIVPKGEMTGIVVTKNSISFDYGRGDNDNMMNSFMKIKAEPLEYYDQNGTLFPVTHTGLPMNLYTMEKQQNVVLEDAQNRHDDETMMP
ncbi:unnamed protein product [Orchesella dallaii]|uniref:BTB domain-containing protein n=1 Tax=Orchesella dallaii TaxID=48710 RepID=A0ABP1QKU2_9HEXA